MATTLTRPQTDLMMSQRSQINESGDNGDWWGWATQFSGFTTTQYNAFTTQYNSWESEADSSVLTGTNSSGNHYLIGSLPNRPRPVEK